MKIKDIIEENTWGACARWASTFLKKNKNGVPYLISDDYGATHIVIKLNNRYYDEFGNYSISEIRKKMKEEFGPEITIKKIGIDKLKKYDKESPIRDAK